MNQDHLSGKWKEFKGEIRNQWGRLTEDELESVKGNIGAIAGLIQQRYGDAKDAVSQKLDEIWARFDTKAEQQKEQGAGMVVDATEKAKNSLRDMNTH